jgi:hypothetical protein
MSDPELAARAQRAAVRLEQSWERWRRLRGLNTEKSQPISSYVGYSLVEPWGRPRVVFGVGAEEAEQLSALLESDERADPRYNQGLLWEPEIPAQAQASPSQPIERAAQGRVSAEHGRVQAEHGRAHSEHSRVQAEHNGERAQSNGERGTRGEWGRTGYQEPVATFSEPVATFSEPAGAFSEPAGSFAEPVGAFSAAPVCEPGTPRREPVPDLVADLAGWSSGELPGQASAGLAEWPGAKAEAERQAARPAGRVEPQATPEPRPGSNSPEPTGWLRLA